MHPAPVSVTDVKEDVVESIERCHESECVYRVSNALGETHELGLELCLRKKEGKLGVSRERAQIAYEQ